MTTATYILCLTQVWNLERKEGNYDQIKRWYGVYLITIDLLEILETIEPKYYAYYQVLHILF